MNDLIALVNLDETSCRFTARKLRGERVYCVILPAGATLAEVRETEARGVIVCGGAMGEAPECPLISELVSAPELPLLAMGDAALTLCVALGGSLSADKAGQAVAQVRFAGDSPILRDVEDGERLLRCRRGFELPGEGLLCMDAEGPLGFRRGSLYGFAFQNEQNDPDGTQLLLNFSTAICGCSAWWDGPEIVHRAVEEIRLAAGDGEALCLISGGVDSTVCAMLGKIALGDRLTCLLIDTGLMREGEADEVVRLFEEDLGISVRRISAHSEFMDALDGVTGTRDKVRTVFAILRALTRHEVSDRAEVRLVLQGTNYSDLLGSDPPADLELTGVRVRLLEPLRDLFKDEVRRIGAEVLHLPESVAQRQPFPGAGLALRVLGAVTPERLSIERQADAIFCQEVEDSGVGKKLWQYYTVLDAPDDGAENGSTVILRAIQVTGQSAALAARLPSDLLERVTGRILSGIPGVRNVVYDLTPSTSYARMEWK
ncbi:MAG: hypothetical protein IKP40_10800 [Clostridia bacterium]|nr:hypothetical protein [Clostridia bacterium]